MDEETRKQMRWFLSDRVRKVVDWAHTDQHAGRKPPPVQKPADPESATVALPPREAWPELGAMSVQAAISARKSRRTFGPERLSQSELAFLLWATQGVRRRLGPHTVLRTVPSAGGRHAFETYVAVLNVAGLSTGLYRYLPLDHTLLALQGQKHDDHPLGDSLIQATLGQRFCGEAAATFIWTVVPYRTEWRYDLAAYRVLLMDVGHVCQNLYLACESIGAGTCAVGAYDQEALDTLLDVDGEDEFAIYLAPVGKV